MSKLWDTVLIIVVIILILASALVYISPRLGLSIDDVTSGSMSPTLHVGTLVLANRVDPAELKVGDIIIFKPASATTYNVCHRIVQITNNRDLTFKTQGDAALQADSAPVAAADVVGRVVVHIDFLGNFVSFLKTTIGLIVCLIIPALYIIYLCGRELRQEISKLTGKKNVKEVKL